MQKKRIFCGKNLEWMNFGITFAVLFALKVRKR